jgi:hypothetical protein
MATTAQAAVKKKTLDSRLGDVSIIGWRGLGL